MASSHAIQAYTNPASRRLAVSGSHLPRSTSHVARQQAEAWAAPLERCSNGSRCRWSRGTCTKAWLAAAAAASSEVSVAADSPAAALAAAVKTQLLRCELGGSSSNNSGESAIDSSSSGNSSPSSSSSGNSSPSSSSSSPADVLWLEVVRSRQGRVEAVCNGELLQLSAGPEGQVVASPAGFLPRLGDPWVKSVPALADSLKKIRQQQAADGSLPSQLMAERGVAALQLRQTLAQFCAEVAAAPGLWCDGTGPEDPPLSNEQQALLTAGELAAFLAGLRGVSLLQLLKGWGDAGAARQPLLRPWVLPLLQQAAAHKSVALLASAAPGAPQLGASLVLCSRQQPFHAWGKHLAGQGVQSSIVADSPFYKLLIGRILGYRPENIYHHIESTGGRVSKEVVQAVDAELAALSSAPPSLPWGSGRR